MPNQGCEQSSCWADRYDGNSAHLAARDTTLGVVSSAPFAQLEAYQRRMGWADLIWVSSYGSEFNFDHGVSVTDAQRRDGATFNDAHVDHPNQEIYGASVFATDDTSAVYHAYSTYGASTRSTLPTSSST